MSKINKMVPCPIQNDTRCITYNCDNHVHEGAGVMFVEHGAVFFICAPCFEFMTKGEGKCSQLYHNAQYRK